MLPDRSGLIGEKLAENAKIQMRHFQYILFKQCKKEKKLGIFAKKCKCWPKMSHEKMTCNYPKISLKWAKRKIKMPPGTIPYLPFEILWTQVTQQLAFH